MTIIFSKTAQLYILINFRESSETRFYTKAANSAALEMKEKYRDFVNFSNNEWSFDFAFKVDLFGKWMKLIPK